MSLGISGMGWVTPLGHGVPEVWQRLLAGEKAAAEFIDGPQPDRRFQIFRVPATATATAPAHPRLRRAGAISRFAVAAGLEALADAGIRLDPEAAKRTAIIFAISNGGVVYTKRFYHDIVATGAQAASPLLFPETVFNAPASHLAAILGITGASYTLVGDGAVGLLALKMAEDLMVDPALDRCLVVGAEEADGLLCDAYHRWRLRITLSEGAGALLVNRAGAISVDAIDAGCNFAHQREAAQCVEEIFAHLGVTNRDLIIASANGTFVDRAEGAAIANHCKDAPVYAPKAALGESVGASSLWQVICGAQALKTQQIPGSKHFETKRAVVSACGLNQQVAGLTMTSRGDPSPQSV
ncbi:MAG: beta-ketoacyl synthase N-terminal-like domain-containing protein [Chthoniobacterales bacterium]